MKKISEFILKGKINFYQKIINILGLCGTCFIIACKYGSEIITVNMSIKGTIKSKDSLQVIPNLNVKITNALYNSETQTDEKGEYSINTEIEQRKYIYLRVTDVDGDLNGSFLMKDTSAVLTSEEINNQLKNIDITLERE